MILICPSGIDGVGVILGEAVIVNVAIGVGSIEEVVVEVGASVRIGLAVLVEKLFTDAKGRDGAPLGDLVDNDRPENAQAEVIIRAIEKKYKKEYRLFKK